MRFLVRKRRSAPTVIIVALVDVLIVLLIFLMVTTTFKQRPTLKLQLPESSQALKPGATTNDVPFIVSITSNAVVVVGMDRMPIPFDSLKARLQSEAAKNPQLKLAINADRNAPWYRIVSVMDIAKELKIKSVSASTIQSKDAGNQ
ncbi:MAG TPA: biopolymer transporter ExbD [Verrucomicrobiae bacterium]|jgi:biopolymer transport protein ExbD|nr:biopolymer transporter ExbD [Verrucomicrobiae bacterium]